MLKVDQALFPLLMTLKWVVPEYQDCLIPRLGGRHTSMNFLKVLGQQIQDSGLLTIWIESGILSPRTVERALAGKDYNKGTRVHKINLQAMSVATAFTTTFGLFGREGRRTKTKSREDRSDKRRKKFTKHHML